MADERYHQIQEKKIWCGVLNAEVHFSLNLLGPQLLVWFGGVMDPLGDGGACWKKCVTGVGFKSLLVLHTSYPALCFCVCG